MADYYLILKKTISGLAHNSQEARDAVYDKARSVISDQLKAIKPAPAEAAIEKQMELLEAAMKKLDNEFSQSAESQTSEDDWGNIPSDNNVSQSASVDPLGMKHSETILAENPDVGGMGNKNMADHQGGWFFSKLFLITLMIVVVGGGLYALWMNRQAFRDDLMESEKSQIADSRNDNKTNVGASDSGNQFEISTDGDKIKNSERLTPDGKTVGIMEEEPGAKSAVNGQGYNVEGKSGTINNMVSPEQAERHSGNNAQQVTEIGKDSKTNQSSSNTAPTIAQKAFFYEEGTSGEANSSRDNAAIVWSLEREKTGNDKNEVFIKGRFDVPGRNIGMNLEIRRNHDDSLPASHVIKIMFRLPRDFNGGYISDILRFVMKPAEQARGESLIAVSAKVSANNFLIALNNLKQARDINRKLLLENAWIDLPLKYTNDNRALIALEKGAIGNKIFQEAFADWSKP